MVALAYAHSLDPEATSQEQRRDARAAAASQLALAARFLGEVVERNS
jgi:hypothetical protein